MTDARENLVRKLVEKIATEQNYDNPDIETAAIPATGANYCSQLFTATVKSEGKQNLKLFAKVSIMGATMLEQAGDIFLVERFFYTELIQMYQALENKHNVPEEHRLTVPKLYGHSENYLQDVIVLEDLSERGYTAYDRLKSVDWDYAAKAMEELAKFHALSVALQRERPDDYKHALEIVVKGKMFTENGPFDAIFKSSMPQTIQMAKEENRPKLQRFQDRYTNDNNFAKIVASKKISVIVHHDYRPSNLMYKFDENKKLQLAMLDFQLLQEVSVAVDLMHFIFIGSDGAFRAKYYYQLIDHYYENLAAALRRLHLDPEEVFPRADFDEELSQVLPYGLAVAITTLPLITVDIERMANSEDGAFETESIDAIGNLASKSNAMCANRMNEVIEDYVRWGLL